MTLHILDELVQGTEAWHDARRGIVTASTVGRLLTVGAPNALTVDCHTCSATIGNPCLSLAATKGEPKPIKTIHEARTALAASQPPVVSVANSDTSRALVATLVSERISGFTEDGPMTSDMWRGVEVEPIARDFYAEHTKATVTEIGFMTEDRWGFTIGYSPDGLVGDDGLLEVKAPRAKGQVLAVLADEVPAYNVAQIQCGLLVSGRDWCDYAPFVGGLPMWTKRVYPDPDWHAAIVAAVQQFETTAAEMVAAYKTATEGLPLTERVPDYNTVELKLA